jgi:protein involved in plasmid replication-relaxation
MGPGEPDSFCEVAVPLAAEVEILQAFLHFMAHLQELRIKDFTCGNLEMRVRVHSKNSLAKALSCMPFASPHGEVLRLRRDDEVAGAMKVRLTERCTDLLRLLRAARWLTTGQVRRRFFPHTTVDAVHKRLRKLTEATYLKMVREHRMTEALFTLGPEAKRVLERTGAEEIVLERQPPKQLDHFIGINDLRIAAEGSAHLGYFFACWELPGLGWSQAIIPDAVFSLAHRTFAVEFDRGKEGIRYFMRTKLAAYLHGLEGFPLAAVLVVTDRNARMVSLANMIAHPQSPILYTTLDLVREHGILAPVFHRQVGQDALPLLQGLWSDSLDVQRGFSREVSINHAVEVVTDPPIKEEKQ